MARNLLLNILRNLLFDPNSSRMLKTIFFQKSKLRWKIMESSLLTVIGKILLTVKRVLLLSLSDL